jgi:hypothetical protein
MATVAPRDAGTAGGVLQTMQQTGSSLGLAVLVTVFGTASRHAAKGATPGVASTHHVLVSGMTAAFAAASVFAACTVVVALTFRSIRTPSSGVQSVPDGKERDAAQRTP